MPIFRLVPFNLDSRDWDASTHRGEVVVRARRRSLIPKTCAKDVERRQPPWRGLNASTRSRLPARCRMLTTVRSQSAALSDPVARLNAALEGSR